jgi:hypothetical protein
MATPLKWNSGGKWNTGKKWNGMVSASHPKPMQIALKLDGLSPEDISQKLKDTAAALTEHAADFTGITPSAADMTAAAGLIDGAISTVKGKEQEVTATMMTRDGLAQAGATVLSQAAAWTVQKQVDPAKAANVFTLKKEAVPMSSVGQVQGLAVTFGDNPGELDAVWQPVAGAKSYELQCFYPATPAVPWAHADTVSGSKATLYSMPSATTVQLRVRAVGPKGMKGPWSDIAQHLVP